MAAAPSIGRASAVEAPARPREAELTQTLFERYSHQLYGFCFARLGSREEAEDAVQTTFLNAFRALERGVVPQSETAWLFKIAENVCLSRHRSSFRRRRVEAPTDLEQLQDVVPARQHENDELVGLEGVLARMPESQRRAILLREWQGLSYREIAEEMELTQPAVETLIFRARRSLAQGLEALDPDLARPLRRRARRGADAGGLIASLKTFLGTSAGMKAAATVVAVGSASVVAAAPRHHAAGSELPKHKVPPAAVRHPRAARTVASAAPAAPVRARPEHVAPRAHAVHVSPRRAPAAVRQASPPAETAPAPVATVAPEPPAPAPAPAPSGPEPAAPVSQPEHASAATVSGATSAAVSEGQPAPPAKEKGADKKADRPAPQGRGSDGEKNQDDPGNGNGYGRQKKDFEAPPAPAQPAVADQAPATTASQPTTPTSETQSETEPTEPAATVPAAEPDQGNRGHDGNGKHDH